MADAAQTAGVVPIDMWARWAGRRGVHRAQEPVRPPGHGRPRRGGRRGDRAGMKVGGSGTHSHDRHHPARMPEAPGGGHAGTPTASPAGRGPAYRGARCGGAGRAGARWPSASSAACAASTACACWAGRRRGALRHRRRAQRREMRTPRRSGDALNDEFGICTRAGARAPLMHGRWARRARAPCGSAAASTRRTGGRRHRRRGRHRRGLSCAEKTPKVVADLRPRATRWPSRPPAETGLQAWMIPVFIRGFAGVAAWPGASCRGAGRAAGRLRAAAWHTRPCTRWNCTRHPSAPRR